MSWRRFKEVEGFPSVVSANRGLVEWKEMMTGFDDRCFASITEFSIAAQDIRDALRRFEKRSRHIEVGDLRRLGFDEESLGSIPSPDYEHFCMLTFGITDIVEIAHFNQIYHLFGVAESDAHSSRKSIGARCLTTEALQKRADGHKHERFCLLPKLFRRDPVRPFLAITYLRLSTALRLFTHSVDQGGCEKGTLISLVFESLLGGVFPIWEDRRRVLAPTHELEDLPAIVLTPLVGLDSVDVILVYRAARLEQIAALTWAARHQKLGSLVATGGGEEVEDFIEYTFMHVRGNIDYVRREWNSAALFKEVRTNWGMPLHLDRDSGIWSVEREKDPEQLAAAGAAVFAVKRAAPDRFLESLESFEIVGRRRECLEGDFLMLLGRADSLSPGGELRELRVAEIRAHFEYLTGLRAQEGGLMAGIWPDTEIAVRLNIPSGYEWPTYDLMRRFRNVLREKIIHDFDRAAADFSWTLQWLDGTKGIGTSYGTTNVVVNLIRSIMGYLERDPEGFSDLLPLLRDVINVVERKHPTQREVTWLVTRLRSLFVSLTRQFYPLQSPYASSIFEGNTGYRRAYDAFVVFSKAMLMGVSPGCSVIVLESAGGGLSCEVGPYGFVILRVSPFVLHYPVAWLVTPEFVHARLANASVEELESAGLGQEIMELGGGLEGTISSSENTVERAFERFGEFLERNTEDSAGRIFVTLLRSIAKEVLADITLWRSLRLGDETPVETNERFWFVHGPGIAAAVFRIAGYLPPSLDIVMSLMLRVFFCNYVLWYCFERREGDASESPREWSELLGHLLRRLSGGGFHMEDVSDDYARDHLERSYVHLNCMKLDLKCPEGKWLAGLRILEDSRGSLTEAVEVSVSRWISAVQPLVDLWLIRGAEEEDAHVRHAYAKYLSALIEKWETSDPWPPFIFHREAKMSLGEDGWRNLSVEQSRIRRRDPHGGFLPARGGVFVRGEGGTLEGQKAYHRLTGELIEVLEDLSRRFRAEELRKFLQVPLSAR